MSARHCAPVILVLCPSIDSPCHPPRARRSVGSTGAPEPGSMLPAISPDGIRDRVTVLSGCAGILVLCPSMRVLVASKRLVAPDLCNHEGPYHGAGIAQVRAALRQQLRQLRLAEQAELENRAAQRLDGGRKMVDHRIGGAQAEQNRPI